MKIALYANPKKSNVAEIAHQVKELLEKAGCSLYALGEMQKALHLTAEDITTLDCVICIGGDGTILSLFQQFPQSQTPVLGINAGHLGFLTEIPLDELHSTLDAFLKGEYTIQERLMMQGVFGETSFHAINDIVIHRSSIPSLVDLTVTVDGELLNTFCADGMILSTPSGSTAYSLSAGGPILSPDIEAFVFTPICPHTISNRPIVLMPEKDIIIEYQGKRKGVEITYDGHSPHKLLPGQSLRITPSKKRFRVVKMKRQTYFKTLRSKLGWSGQVRYKNEPITHSE